MSAISKLISYDINLDTILLLGEIIPLIPQKINVYNTFDIAG
jgi:hypothetical protein